MGGYRPRRRDPEQAGKRLSRLGAVDSDRAQRGFQPLRVGFHVGLGLQPEGLCQTPQHRPERTVPVVR